MYFKCTSSSLFRYMMRLSADEITLIHLWARKVTSCFVQLFPTPCPGKCHQQLEFSKGRRIYTIEISPSRVLSPGNPLVKHLSAQHLEPTPEEERLLRNHFLSAVHGEHLKNL